MSVLTNEPIPFEVDTSEDWDVTIYDTDVEDGSAISHAGADLRCTLKDADGVTPSGLDLSTGGGQIKIEAGTTNGINIVVPWATVSVLPAGTYTGTIAEVLSATSRKKIVQVAFRHSVA